MSNKPKTREQKFAAWFSAHRNDRHLDYETVWLAGYLSGYRTCQYKGDQRGKVQRAKTRK